METTRDDSRPIDAHTGVTARGELWLELVFISSEDEYHSVALAVPVDHVRERLCWSAATDHDSGLTACRATLRDLPTWQAAGIVPDDASLIAAWVEGEGPETRRAWLLDVAI